MKNERRERERLRSAISMRRSATSPLPADIREAAIAYAMERIADGASRALVAEELGLTPMTVNRWMSGLRERDAPEPKLRLVQVEAISHPSDVPGIVVTTPRGLRIENLDIQGLCALLEKYG